MIIIDEFIPSPYLFIDGDENTPGETEHLHKH